MNRINSFTERQSNFELLRIVSMVMIMSLHFVGNSGMNPSGKVYSNSVWYQMCCLGGSLGNDIFILISGYFSINEGKIKAKKIIIFWSQVFFYSVFSYLVITCYQIWVLKNIEISWSGISEVVFPIIHNQWWFASTYFVLMVISPFINILLKNIGKKQYIFLLLFMFTIWSVIPCLFHIEYQYSHLGWFVFLYSLSGYIRIYNRDIIVNTKHIFTITIVCFSFLLGLYFLCSVFKNDIIIFDWLMYSFGSINGLPILIMALSIFITFKNLNISKKRVINLVASATFGVYLIHDNKFISQFLSNHVYNKVSIDSKWYVPYFIVTVLGLFLICTLIELGRKYLFEIQYLNCIDHISEMISKRIKHE